MELRGGKRRIELERASEKPPCVAALNLLKYAFDHYKAFMERYVLRIGSNDNEEEERNIMRAERRSLQEVEAVLERLQEISDGES